MGTETNPSCELQVQHRIDCADQSSRIHIQIVDEEKHIPQPPTEQEKRGKRTIPKTFEELFSEIAHEQDLEICQILNKGRGIKTKRKYSAGEWVVEYIGSLLTKKEADMKAKEYSTDPNIGSFMFYFKSQEKALCIDATIETTKKGRLINHSIRHENIKPIVYIHHNTPRIIFVARKDINIGEELLYDYGERSVQAIKDHPWLASTAEMTSTSTKKNMYYQTRCLQSQKSEKVVSSNT